MITFQGLLVGYALTAASIDERDAVWDMTDAITGVLLGDKGYIRPWLKTELAEQGNRVSGWKPHYAKT